MLAGGWGLRYSKGSFRKRELVISNSLPETLKGTRWLDLGCGIGNLAMMLSKRGASVLGVDGSINMITEAQSCCSRFSGIAFLHIQDIESWQWTGDPFDGILCSSVLEYLKQPGSLVKKLACWIKPGGQVLLTVPNRTSLFRKSQKICFSFTRLMLPAARPAYLAYSVHDFTGHSFRSLLESSGFGQSQITYFGLPGRLNLPESSFLSPLILACAIRD